MAENEGLGFNPDERLSSRFLLRDLIKTSYPVVNHPSVTQTQNLRRLALMLDELFTQIGPFDIESAFRTAELQAMLAKTNPQAAANSFHVQGIAADVTPTTMSAESWFTKLLASPLRSQLGEIALKNFTIHLSLATPLKQDVPMRVVNNQYIRLSGDEVKGLLSKYGYKAGIGAAAIVVAAASGFLVVRILKKMPRRATA